MTQQILLVEDDENLRVALLDNLQDEGYVVVAVTTAAAAQDWMRVNRPDIIVLDIMLPDGDGYSFCRQLRDGGCDAPVLMLTARSLEDDLLMGFNAGADDYLTKPFRLKELLARTAALTRRGTRPTHVTKSYSLEGFRIDAKARTVHSHGGTDIELTRKEFDLLLFLLEHDNRVLSRDQILDRVWGRGVVVDYRTVDNFISNLRRKLTPPATAGWRIVTVRGLGYRFER